MAESLSLMHSPQNLPQALKTLYLHFCRPVHQLLATEEAEARDLIKQICLRPLRSIASSAKAM